MEGTGHSHAREAPRILVQAVPDERETVDALRRGLLAADASIEPKFFYDHAGSALFDAICGTPEYYLTRTEAAIFERFGPQIRDSLPAQVQWIDLGCASGSKSMNWLRAVSARRFVGVDIAQGWLHDAVRSIAGRFPGVECLGVVTDFADSLDIRDIVRERRGWNPVFFYPGSSIGNFSHAGALRFLSSVRGHLEPGGALLIGADLVKEEAIIERAYNDAQGLTAAFNRNALHVANRLLGADFVPERFAHEAKFHRGERRIEMRLRASAPQRVRLGKDVRTFEEGDCILTEHCHKYTLEGFGRLLADAGFSRRKAWTDADEWFGVFLAMP